MGAFQRPQIGDILDHHDHRRVAAFIGANRARIGGVDVSAHRADRDALHGGLQGDRQWRHQLFALLDERQGGAARRARAEARQAGQELDQALDFRTGDGGGHLAQNSCNPGGNGRPPVRLFIFSCSKVSALRRASAWAATTRSSAISFSSGFINDGSNLTLLSSPLAVIVTRTMPPPAVPSTSIWSSSACMASILVLSSVACFIRPRKSAISRLPLSAADPLSLGSLPRKRGRESLRAQSQESKRLFRVFRGEAVISVQKDCSFFKAIR